MKGITSWLVWLSRIHRSRGFGIQSPIDYEFVRYVVNEHCRYYAYSHLGMDDNWLRKKLGRLYFRVANWRQPTVVESDDYHEYIRGACKNVSFGDSSEMLIISLNSDGGQKIPHIYNKVNDKTVLIVEGIHADKHSSALWKQLISDERSGVAFDLYYCGIVFFDTKRYKRVYIINF